MENLQSHIKCPFQKRVLVAKEAAVDVADVQHYLVEYLSEGEQHAKEEPSLKNFEEIDFSKDEGDFEASNSCLKMDGETSKPRKQCTKILVRMRGIVHACVRA